MTIRDPRSREHSRPAAQVEGRDPTQSLSLPPENEEDLDDSLDDEEDSHPSLAVGTHERPEEHTKVESPGAARKTPAVAVQRLSSKPSKASRTSVHASDNLDDHSGSTLGSYKVCELLGKGGMGFVYRAEHVKLGREVAIKLLRNDYARRRDAVARFIQEARTVNRIRHRNIVDVPDIVELDDGTTFIVMEFLRGQSLGKWARSGVDLPRALAVLVQICDGLGAAHAVGIVHRDLKPDNVIVVPTSDGAELVKLLDFGVAKLLNRDDEDIGFQTAAGSVIGTPAYMSPEQAGGMAIDARSDIYSLGAIMYELFCGQPMFRGRSFGEYVRKHLTEQPIRPRATQGGAQLDERLEAIILKALEKDPAQRFGHILELRDALLTMLGGMETHPPGFAAISSIRNPGTLPPQPIPHMPTPMSQPSAVMLNPSQFYSQHSQLVPQPAPATPLWVWIAGGAVAVAIGIAGALWYANRTDDKPAAPAPVVQAPIAVPIEPLAPVAPKILTLRFDSLPSGGVFADGRSAELCRTPCAFNVDLNDGGEADKRVFVVKSDGFKDADVTVDLTGTQRAFNVTLERVVAEVIKPVETKHPVRPSHPGKPVIDKKPPVVPDPEITPVTPDPETTKKPKTDGKPPKPIDPTETLDPFHRKP